MAGRTDTARDIAQAVATSLGLSVYDVEEAGGTLRVLLDRPGGIDVDALTTATREISRRIDEEGALGGAATLEVSSPGLERRLRTPEHFAGAVGERVKVKTRPGVEGDRRVDGVLTAADGDTLTVTAADGTVRTLTVDEIERATTEFVWEATPKPGGGGRRSAQSTEQSEARR